MTRTQRPMGNVSCSFCGKGQRDVRKLIMGPNDVYICDECASLCNDIISEELAGESRRGTLPFPGDRALDVRANTLVRVARRLADVSDKATSLPRPVAERARALAEEIEVFLAADADTRAVLAEYARSVALNARHFARVCDAAELPRGIAERARALAVEIDQFLGPPDRE